MAEGRIPKSDGQVKREINVSKVSSFTYKSDVCAMQAMNPNEVLIGVYPGKEIGLVNRDGQIVKTWQNNIDALGIAITPSGDMLATPLSGNLIKRISQSGVVSIFADMSPYKAYGIHITKDGDILVGLRDDNAGRLVKLSPTGETKQVIEYDDKKSRLYDRPAYITQNINGDIWVSEILVYTGDARITVVDGKGSYRFSYRGPPNVKMEKKFNPGDIVNNQYGQILVADCDNSTIDLLDKDGGFLQYVLTNQDGIIDPWVLSLDDDEQLWVGCWSGQVIVVKYLSQTKTLK